MVQLKKTKPKKKMLTRIILTWLDIYFTNDCATRMKQHMQDLQKWAVLTIFIVPTGRLLLPINIHNIQESRTRAVNCGSGEVKAISDWCLKEAMGNPTVFKSIEKCLL